MHYEVSRVVILTSGEVGVENLLCAGGVALLGIDGSSGHVGNHGVTCGRRLLAEYMNEVPG